MIDQIVTYIDTELNNLADPSKSDDMEQYMKGIQPFLGVQRPDRSIIHKTIKTKYGSFIRKEITNEQYRNLITGVWIGGYREHRYVALFLMEYCKKFIILNNLDFFKSIISEGAWWDTTDTTAQKIIGKILQDNPDTMTPIIKKWSEDNDLWIRRSAILVQLKFKEETDVELLRYVLETLQHEDEFFIQKAIGWALREYSKTNSRWVADYIAEHSEILSNLAIREGSKYLDK